MDIYAAKTLFNKTFDKGALATPKKTVTAVRAINPARNNTGQASADSPCYHAKRTPQPNPITADVNLLKVSEPIAIPKAAAVVEHRSDRFSRAYMNVAETDAPKCQIDTFA